MGHSTAQPTKHKHTNRLSKETSPYLLQHQHNPVDWHAWNDEALARARKENKPIFLSIGYAACHWCHVMERESFENEETAAVMNEHFICIKVDREERPDIDNIYMTAVQMMTGSGGWPLNVFLTPDLKPFYGGTYWPPDEKFGRPAFRTVLLNVAKAWREKPDDLANGADRLTQAIQANTAAPPSTGELDKEMLTRATAQLRVAFDSLYGGFGAAPKFPPSGSIALLLRQHHQTADKEALEMAALTLDRMAYGGMYDQLGGGFHRYSVDPYWLVPHFEKMLYDNALLARVYLEAWQVTKNDLYRRVATETLDYILRDMTDARGGFHSSEDADSEGVEGKFYVWIPAEIAAVLGEKDGAFFSKHYDVTEKGNFEEHNILNVPLKTDEARESAEKQLAPLRAKLLAARAKRIRPGKDDKVLASWNGMMISALAHGHQALGDERYRQAAEKAANFILKEMVRGGVLLRTWRGAGGPAGQGEGKLPAYLDDYAQMAAAFTDLYEATFDLKWLEEADRLLQKAVDDFWDEKDGGFFDTGAIHKHLLVRTKSFYDGAEPSGNAVAALTLLRLAKLLDKPDYAKKAETILAIMSVQMQRQPRAHTYLLCAVDFRQQPTREIALAGKKRDAQTEELLRTIHQRFIPNKVLALIEPNTPGAEQAERRIPLLKNKVLLAGKATAYVCENYACKQPVNDPKALAAALR